MAKQKAEYEREKKKIIADHDSQIEQLRRDHEEATEKELKS